jgi:CheY-like chemotaxis protein
MADRASMRAHVAGPTDEAGSDEQAALPPEDAAGYRHAGDHRGKHGDMKILLIEDDKEAAEYLVKALSESGYVVDHAAEGRDGLFMATSGTYDALIVDRMLPGMDGLSIVAALRAAEIRTPTLILSALGAVAEPRDREAAVITFLVTASGASFFGISGAFWGLVAGGAMLVLTRRRIARTT